MEIEYDVFISFKNSDEEGNHTEDRELAYRLYQFLESKNLKIFFSEATLEELGADSWGNEIENALKVSKIFIALGTKEEYFDSYWLQKERTSFLILKSLDKSKALYSYIASPMTTINLPEDIKGFECFEDSKPKEFERLYNFISNHISLQKTKKKSEIGTILQKRKEEIENYITTNNLNEATLRLMDFTSDFADNRERRNESKDIRAKFNMFRTEERNYGFSEKLTNQYSKLRHQILDFMEDIQVEFNQKNSFINQVNTPIKKTKVSLVNSFFKDKEEFKEKSFNSSNIVFNAKQITKKYKKKKLMEFSLSPIDLTLKYGEITALVGENGSGKTTLLNMIAGELLHSSGEVEYPELENKLKKDDYYHIKTQIAYVPQEIMKWKGYVVDNLHYTLAIDGIYGQENIDEVDFILHRFGLEKFVDSKWNEISGGYKMRFALAKAMLRQPKLLILDEPLSHLDINTAKIFLNDIRNIVNSQKHKMSAIISSQHIYELEDITNNIVFLKEGEVIYNGSIKNFGEERKKNIYEVNVDIDVNKLIEILKIKEDIRIEVTGENYIIEMPLEITSKKLMQILWEHNLTVKYFRDISKSTRKLFMKDI